MKKYFRQFIDDIKFALNSLEFDFFNKIIFKSNEEAFDFLAKFILYKVINEIADDIEIYDLIKYILKTKQSVSTKNDLYLNNIPNIDFFWDGKLCKMVSKK